MHWTTVSPDEMAMIADMRVIRHKWFLADVTPRRATPSIATSTIFP